MTTTSINMSALTLASTGAELPEWGGERVPESLIENPLVQEWNTPYATPPFDKIELADYEPAFDFAIAVNRAEIETIRRQERYNLGCAAQAGAADILEQLKKRQEAKKTKEGK